jgi:hypothetical protein
MDVRNLADIEPGIFHATQLLNGGDRFGAHDEQLLRVKKNKRPPSVNVT